MSEIKQQLVDRLRAMEILSDFDVDRRMSTVNAALCSQFATVDILKNVLNKAKESGTDIRMSSQALEQILAVFESVGFIIFTACNTKKVNFEAIVQKAGMDKFIRECSKKETEHRGQIV